MVPTKVSVASFVNGLKDERRKQEANALIAMMKQVTGEQPVMWGPSIIGFGSYHYKYESGREGDAPRAGFSPRGAALTVYCMPGFPAERELLDRLGPHKTSVSCLYIKRLEDVDQDVLREIVERTYGASNVQYPPTSRTAGRRSAPSGTRAAGRSSRGSPSRRSGAGR